MQIQKINTQISHPNFQAKNLSRVVSTADNGVKSVIDIYSVDKHDREFLDKFSKSINGKKLPEDAYMIVGKDPEKSVQQALKKAMFPNDKFDNHLLVAVADKKNVVGILNYEECSDMNIDTLYMLKDDKQSMGRKALLLQALKNINEEKFFYAVIPSERLNKKSYRYYNSLGFNKENSGNLIIEDAKIPDKIDKIKSNAQFYIWNYDNSKNINLNKMVNINN